MLVLRPSLKYTQRFTATEERYVRTLSDCIPTTHMSPSKNKNINYMFLYESKFESKSDSMKIAKNIIQIGEFIIN